MSKTVRIHEYGGPEVLRIEDVPPGEPGPGEALLRQHAIGVNFADIHTREGRYPLPHLPHAIGGEAMGVVEALGAGVSGVRVGDRVAYSTGGHALPRGAYAEARVVPADRLVPLPDAIDDETAAAMITKGLTAQYLLRDAFPVATGHTILVHSAAGGVGSILSQWASHIGATVIGVVGSDTKAPEASANGCTHVIVSGREDIAARARELTGGEGVAVVYDAVGKDTFEASLHALRPRGMLVSYGTSSGPIPPFDIFKLNQLGSLYVTSAAFYWHMRTGEEMRRRADDLIESVISGAVRISVNQRFSLDEVADAHRAMESRKTTGMTVLIP